MTLDLPQELEKQLQAEAVALHLPLPEYVLRVLSIGRQTRKLPRNGAELVAYWESERLLGTRPEISDSQEHSRDLRRAAEQRQRG